jgi:autotransporter-associated beta strand protein
MKKLACKILALLATGFISIAAAQAQTQTWNNASTDGLWNGSSLNWSDSTLTPDTWSSGGDAIFGTTGAGTVTIATGGVTANSLTFNAPGYSTTGGALTLTGLAEITANSDVTIGTEILGTAGLVKSGAGTMTWSTYYPSAGFSGPITVNAGQLSMTQALNNATMGSGNSAVTIASGATLLLDCYNWGATNSSIGALSGGGTLSLGGTPLSVGADNSSSTFAGAITNNWGGAAFIKVGSGTLTLSGNSYLYAPMTVSGGVLNLTGYIFASGYGGVITVNNGGTLQLHDWEMSFASGFTSGGNWGTQASNMVIDGGTIDMATSYTDSGRGFTIGAGGATLAVESGVTWQLNNDRGWQYYHGAVTVDNNSSLTLDGAGTGQVNIVVNGTGTLTKNGGGTWSLGVANGYTGNTTVNAGTLILAANGSISGSPLVDIKAGATFDTTSQTFTMLGTQTFRFTINGTTGQVGTLNAGWLDITNGVVDFSTIGVLTSSAYVIANYSYLTGAAFSSVLDLPTGYTLDYTYGTFANEIALVQTVPEPSTWAMLLGGLGMLTMFRRRRA